MAKIREGDDIGAGFLNNHEEVYEWWRRFKARGEGGSLKAEQINFTKVMAANYTESQIYIGEVCEFDGNPFPDPDLTENYPDPRNDRWLKAVTPDLSHHGWGIALDPIPGDIGSDREGGQFLVLGVCYARVVITDEDHLFARREAGQRSLQSSDRGAVKLLHVGSPTGNDDEYLCLVHIVDDTPLWYLGITRYDFTQGVDAVFEIDVWAWDTVTETFRQVPGFIIQARDWFLNAGEEVERGTKVRVDWYISTWVVTAMYCSPTDLEEYEPVTPPSVGELEALPARDDPFRRPREAAAARSSAGAGSYDYGAAFNIPLLEPAEDRPDFSYQHDE